MANLEPLEGRAVLSALGPRAAAHAAAISPANAPPVILTADVVLRSHAIVAFTITFTKDVVPGPLTNLSHYALFSQTRRSLSVPLSSATYDAPNRTLTLTPASPAPLGLYVLTSPNPNDKSTAFISDAQGRPLLTASRSFTVYFDSHGPSLRNIVMTASPAVNRMTGANIILPLLASTRGRSSVDGFLLTDLGVRSGALIGSLLL